MAVKTPLYGPRVDREVLNAGAMAIRPLAIRGCLDLANKLNYMAGVRLSALNPDAVLDTIGLCTTMMTELAIQSDPSRYLTGDEVQDMLNTEMISDMVQSRCRARELVGLAREQLKEMMGSVLTV